MIKISVKNKPQIKTKKKKKKDIQRYLQLGIALDFPVSEQQIGIVVVCTRVCLDNLLAHCYKFV